MTTTENTPINLIHILDKMLDTYANMNKSIYKPLASTIHNHVPFTEQLGITEFSTVGLWFMATFGVPHNTTIDAEAYMERAVDPILGHELHALLLLLNNEFDIAMQFDGRFDTDERRKLCAQLPNRFEYAVYNDWAGLDKHIQELQQIRDVYHNHLSNK